MVILALIGVFIVLSCLRYLSKTSKIVLSVLLICTLYYWYSISQVFHGGAGPEFDEIKIALTLFNANVGGLVLAIVLGIMRHKSENEAQYLARRKKLFLFLFKWGGIYTVYSMVGGKILDYVIGQEGIGWLLMKGWGVYGFVVLLLLWFFLKKSRES